MMDVKFEIGERYKNMKGTYEVLSIDKDTMRIRWDSGEEVTTTVSLQSRIVKRMRREQQKREEGK
jgi:hypothetical protein